MAQDPSVPTPDVRVVDPSTGLMQQDWYDFLRSLRTSITTINRAFTDGNYPFPSTQVPSSDPNTLDDYEEGTWTPVLTFATPGTLSVTYAQQTGAYVKIGSAVWVNVNIVTSAVSLGTASGGLRITGLPFASNQFGVGVINCQGITKASYTQFMLISSASLLAGVAAGSGQANVNIDAADIVPLAGVVVLRSSLTYRVALT